LNISNTIQYNQNQTDSSKSCNSTKNEDKDKGIFIEFLEINPSLIVSGMSTRCEIESFEGEE
jgi:hypothetical protein